MEILLLLVPLSVLLVGTALAMFVRAVDGGQFDALDDHAMDIFDDAPARHSEETSR